MLKDITGADPEKLRGGCTNAHSTQYTWESGSSYILSYLENRVFKLGFLKSLVRDNNVNFIFKKKMTSKLYPSKGTLLHPRL